MKKLFAIIFVLAVLLTAVACNGDEGNKTDDTTVADTTLGDVDDTTVGGDEGDTTTEDPSETDEPTDTTTDVGNDDPVDPTDDFLKVDIDTEVYSTDTDGTHLEGVYSALYEKPDRATLINNGGIADGTAVKVTAVLYEDETDPTVGWAHITYDEGKTAYIRISQLKYFVELGNENANIFDLSGFMQSGENLHEYTDEEMAAFEAMIAENEGTVTVNTDGSITLSFADGDATQYEDGSWLIESADGTVATVGNIWPENELTERVPSPTAHLTFTSTAYMPDMEYFAAMLDPATEVSALKAYAEVLKTAGFTVDVEELEGAGAYAFSAANADGYSVMLAAAEGNVVMGIALAE